jgi:hypothetical protein
MDMPWELSTWARKTFGQKLGAKARSSTPAGWRVKDAIVLVRFNCAVRIGVELERCDVLVGGLDARLLEFVMTSQI